MERLSKESCDSFIGFSAQMSIVKRKIMNWKFSIKQNSIRPHRETFTILQKNRGGYRANYYVHFLVYVIFMSGKPIDVVQNMFSNNLHATLEL